MPAYPTTPPPRSSRPKPGNPPGAPKFPKRDKTGAVSPTKGHGVQPTVGARPMPRPKLPPRLGGTDPHEKGFTTVAKPGGTPKYRP